MKRLVIATAVVLVGCASESTDTTVPEISGDLIREHMQRLASDDFMGRGAGSDGGRRAAEYIANQFEAAGLQPVEGSYFQTVRLVGTTPQPSEMELRFSRGGASLSPEYLDDFVLWSGEPESESVGGTGELVFVGYGISAPEADWNDFGVDVAGKIVLILVNDPPAPPEEPDLFGGPAMTYYGRWTYKYEEAGRQGALGAFVIHTTEAAGYPWTVVRGGWSGEQMALPLTRDASPVPLQGWLSYETAARVLALASLDLDELMTRAVSRDFEPVATGIQVDARLTNTIRVVETQNVIGLLPGTSRPDEVITLTSHYDHLGIGEEVDGDSIYNGAYDNASGTALLIALATATAALPQAPPRSLLFIATAAEEQGLLGSAWYVKSPLFPLAKTVAEINVDEANLWGETDDMIAQGEERSGLGRYVEARATQAGLTLMPDAEPEKGFFFRSDHFPFARAGVPSLYIGHGRQFRGKPEGWGDDVLANFAANQYHAPSDEFTESFVFSGAVQQGWVILGTALDIARDDTWPNWFEGSEFRAARDAMRPGG
ncbi:MAG: M28 family metallopeptidase [Gemmatimonadota bacterium]|nr:MAG: M28 family metallopeptidase [Gemmatimonadota bacterium]